MRRDCSPPVLRRVLCLIWWLDATLHLRYVWDMFRMVMTASVLLFLGTGCDLLAAGGCDLSAVSSVTVSVVDLDGDFIAADDVTYDVDSLGEEPCSPLDAEGFEWTCGVEETGNFFIRAYVGGAVYTGETSVRLREDGCHVDPQFLDIIVL